MHVGLTLMPEAAKRVSNFKAHFRTSNISSSPRFKSNQRIEQLEEPRIHDRFKTLAHDSLIHTQSRSEAAMATKRKHGDTKPSIEEEPVDPADQFEFFCLGGGQEVGRSCHIIRYKGKTVMLDAGMHPAYEGILALPFYDEWDLSTVDVLLISQ